MGPVTGMTPDKKAEAPGAEKAAGLRQIYRMGSLPEAVDAARPKATLVDSESADDELTNLNWLHESTNLLTYFSLGSEGLPIVSPIYDIEGDNVPSFSPSCYQNLEKKSATSKPPYSFSLLIYMAIEHSPNKSLPVKEIYSWILERFPYFATAPTGWKNSVRHNLSLNKCFQKVERSHGKVNGKGSLWCVDPEYKPNLIQALKKQPFPSALAFYTPPASPPSRSSCPHYLTSVLKQNHGRSLKESDIDAATAMMLLNTSIEQRILDCEKAKPLKMPKKRSYGSTFNHHSSINLQENHSAAINIDPKEDHNYSASSMASQCCASRSSMSSLSSVDEVYEFISKTSHAGSNGSEGFHSEVDTDIDYEDDPLGDSGYAAQPCVDTSDKSQPSKKALKELCQEIDEELKEAAGSLLHLAGISTCLGSLISTAKTQSQKQRKK
ncbi:forkhead box protein N2 isoform X1 [Gopherus flavomarginatus]|uniref:forkhead box protein N2 isoform X1 n=1 Tax=Gopherus flavomarginatus TaxID=286002 RepID=UPI0021CBC865|nr:forkhead box protein N2 isoform X1 [Gopherus flavomarginatus]XP_050807865.1 forkhead box protein N2 isoform X1 [Gopherus flavomarginatus]XP_050807866.1 forkhead box protein N2 isoform X1 [Gopherus flavomarginatus]XP_050807867.1 forkhead box protein N2 isoform X1 [Gopherus flavomarginatus]XP_050807868.1 forkhead box protein N2 isoform X1 [Gopherus flavomarginatus]XP_050807869.1 forkhead box protein N2 isoform X1 [Gopherus flavomarginatus]XP_050807870.1 forkhead box protein N2 isoform X1 [Go